MLGVGERARAVWCEAQAGPRCAEKSTSSNLAVSVYSDHDRWSGDGWERTQGVCALKEVVAAVGVARTGTACSRLPAVELSGGWRGGQVGPQWAARAHAASCFAEEAIFRLPSAEDDGRLISCARVMLAQSPTLKKTHKGMMTGSMLGSKEYGDAREGSWRVNENIFVLVGTQRDFFNMV